jgi:hypothetical protein
MGELPMDKQENKLQMAAINLKGMIAAVPAYIDFATSPESQIPRGSVFRGGAHQSRQTVG